MHINLLFKYIYIGDDSGDLLDKFHKWSDKVVKKLKITFAGITLQPVNNKYYENSFKPKNETEHKSEPTPPMDKISNKDDLKIKSNKMKSNAIKPKSGKSKANDFNLQQRLVREEAKGIRSGITEKKIETEKGGCCGGSSSGEKKEKESCCSTDAKKAEENACCGGSKGTMDGVYICLFEFYISVLFIYE
jgi:hypothetical protein